MKKDEIKESLIYLGFWGLLLLTPVISMLLRMSDDSTLTFNWNEVVRSWYIFIPYLLVFLIHNYIIAPLLVYKKKTLLYGIMMLCVVTVFQLYQCHQKPDMKEGPGFMAPHGNDHFSKMPPPPGSPFDRFEEMDKRPFDPGHERPEHQHERPFDRGHGGPPLILGQQDIVALIVIILMIGMNLGIKLYFKTTQDARKLEKQEKERLVQQLEYLKYQINPHFFMNTLNNIHALVDIDPEEAKKSIVELSKMMRYVLYDGARNQVPLSKDMDFIDNYITLMKLRYTDKVRIETDMPKDIPDKMIPPMLFITFVENAFKHGVSYKKDTFIKISMTVSETRVRFQCGNSKSGSHPDTAGGVGLANTRQRLDLIYGKDYRLDIHDAPDSYEVELEIPFLREG